MPEEGRQCPACGAEMLESYDEYLGRVWQCHEKDCMHQTDDELD